MTKPPVVPAEDWQRERDALLVAEKAATRALDALAARRRRLPMQQFRSDYAFEGPEGSRTLLELFEGRSQLAAYQFMDVGPDKLCPGCTHFTNDVVNLTGLAKAGVSWATISDMPIAQIEATKQRMGWTMPFLSSRGTTFADDVGAGRAFMLTLFLRDGDDVYRT